MNASRITLALLVTGLGPLLSACSVLPQAQPVAIERYTLEVRPAQAAQPVAGDAVLLVSRPQARADLDTPRMAYRQQDYTLRYFARSRWTDTPPQLLLPGLIEALEASGRFAAVVRVGSAATPQLRLDTELLDFSQDFRSEPSRFQLRLRAQLVDLRTRAVIASRVFEAHQPAPAQTPYGGVQAANAAWQALLPEVIDFCAGAASSAR
ncbi:MAG: ABC-type transport auxiliary lipoprotein family protein [Gammaproteobacteria bacterium]